MVAKKSASKAKLVKKPDINLDEEWAAMKLVTMTKLKAEIEIATRLDSILSIRAEAKKFFNKNPMTMADYIRMSKVVEKTYKDILEAYSKLEKEDLMVVETKDPYNHLIDEPSDKWGDMDLFEAMLRFICIQTYGNKFLQDHQRIMELMAKVGMDPLDKEKDNG